MRIARIEAFQVQWRPEEEPVLHYHVRATGEVARKLSITVSAGEQSHTPAAVPHQTQPTIGHLASLHLAATQLHSTKPCELNDPSPRMHAG